MTEWIENNVNNQRGRKSMHEWYYHIDGTTYGPLPENELKKLISDCKLSLDTLVFSSAPNYAERGWIKISETEFAALCYFAHEQTQGESQIFASDFASHEELHNDSSQLKEEFLDLTSQLKSIGVGAAVSIGKELTRAAKNKAVEFNQKLEEKFTPQGEGNIEEENIYMSDVKNEEELKILREKHRMKMESEKMEREKEREDDRRLWWATGVYLGLMLVIGLVIGLVYGLVELVSWFAKNIIVTIVLIVGIVACIITAIVLWHRRLKRQQDIEILKADISTIGDGEAERLAKKYQEN